MKIRDGVPDTRPNAAVLCTGLHLPSGCRGLSFAFLRHVDLRFAASRSAAAA